jgi:hypothetical protein
MDDLGLRVDLPGDFSSDFYRRVVAANSWVETEQRPLDPARDLVWGPHNDWTLTFDVKPDFERWARNEQHFALVAISDTGSESERIAEPGPGANHPGDTVVTNVEGEPGQKASTPREEGAAYTVGDEPLFGPGDEGPAAQPAEGPAPTPESSTDAGTSASTVGGSTSETSGGPVGGSTANA